MANFIRYHGPASKTTWRLSDQIALSAYGFMLMPHHVYEDVYRNGLKLTRKAKLTRAAITPLLGDLTNKHGYIYGMIACKEFQLDPLFVRAAAFIRQQRDHGWAGSWDIDAIHARNPKKLKKLNSHLRSQRLAEIQRGSPPKSVRPK